VLWRCSCVSPYISACSVSCCLQRYYIPSARELQRIESITRSPIYSKFSEALAGVATIRAYRREDYFTAASDELMELNAYAFVTQRAAAAWLAMRLDFMGLVILTCAGGEVVLLFCSYLGERNPTGSLHTVQCRLGAAWSLRRCLTSKTRHTPDTRSCPAPRCCCFGLCKCACWCSCTADMPTLCVATEEE
jgi:hypothetical protein